MSAFGTLTPSGYVRASSFAFTVRPVVVRTLPMSCTNRFVVDQWAATPVLRDVAEQPMLDLVPLRDPRWRVRHADPPSPSGRRSATTQLS
jgi:hypothetical protein